METQTETRYKIRELKRKDRKTVSAMIVKLADKLGNAGILNIISSAGSGSASGSAPIGGGSDSASTPTEQNKSFDGALSIGIEIIKLMLTTLEDDVCAWFASLINKTPEEFDDLPLDIEIQIIDQLRQAPEVGVFFSGAWQQFNEIKKYGNTLQAGKGQ
jgi:hypothetical protein